MSRNHPLPRRLLQAAVPALGLALGLAGCAEPFTYTTSETAEGRTYIDEQDYDAAGQIFARQIQRNPKDYTAFYYLGKSQEGGGREAEAIRSYRTGLEVMPLTPAGRDDPAMQFKLIDALSAALAENDADGSTLAQIDKASKGDADKKLLVAMTHAKAGRPDSALGSFREAMTLDRGDPQIAKQYGLYLESLRQRDAAGQVLTRAYRLDTTDQDVAAALRRVGIVPGPSLLSKNDLATPLMPLGPLPEVKFAEPATPADGGNGAGGAETAAGRQRAAMPSE